MTARQKTKQSLSKQVIYTLKEDHGIPQLDIVRILALSKITGRRIRLRADLTKLTYRSSPMRVYIPTKASCPTSLYLTLITSTASTRVAPRAVYQGSSHRSWLYEI